VKVDILSDTTQLMHLLYTEKWLAWSPFPLFQNTERPDRAVAAMMGGRIVMLLDNTSTAVIVPVTMGVLFQTPDDYYLPTVSGSFLRLIRFMGLMITIFMPALYISLTSVNQDVLRVQIMLAIAASREGVPYPAYIEVLIMMLLVELINEATVRLPKSIGGTATIVGGLIIGTAAAQSHLISNIMIVITAATAIGSFTMANYILGLAWRICSYFIIMLSVSFGLYGMTIGTAFVLLFLCHLKPWGIPYLAPFDTHNFRDLVRDSLFRVPKRMMKFRPATYSNQAAHMRKLRMQSEDEQL
jgi:spore germination protein